MNLYYGPKRLEHAIYEGVYFVVLEFAETFNVREENCYALRSLHSCSASDSEGWPLDRPKPWAKADVPPNSHTPLPASSCESVRRCRIRLKRLEASEDSLPPINGELTLTLDLLSADKKGSFHGLLAQTHVRRLPL